MLERAVADGVALRLPEERDADELYALIDTDRDHLRPWMPWARSQTPEATVEFIRMTRRQLVANNGIQTLIVIDGRIAGVCGLHGISWLNRSTTIGYWLAERYEGRGAMSATVSAYIEHCFGHWRLNRMELSAAVDNVRSRRLAERLGFTEEGVRRQAEIVGEAAHDLVVYGLLASEWNGPA